MKIVLIKRTVETNTSVYKEVLVLEAAFKRTGQEYDWYIADDIFSKYDVLAMDDRTLEILVMKTLQEYGVWDSDAYHAEKLEPFTGEVEFHD